MFFTLHMHAVTEKDKLRDDNARNRTHWFFLPLSSLRDCIKKKKNTKKRSRRNRICIRWLKKSVLSWLFEEKKAPTTSEIVGMPRWLGKVSYKLKRLLYQKLSTKWYNLKLVHSRGRGFFMFGEKSSASRINEPGVSERGKEVWGKKKETRREIVASVCEGSKRGRLHERRYTRGWMRARCHAGCEGWSHQASFLRFSSHFLRSEQKENGGRGMRGRETVDRFS